jgi:hypothetical protein
MYFDWSFHSPKSISNDTFSSTYIDSGAWRERSYGAKDHPCNGVTTEQCMMLSSCLSGDRSMPSGISLTMHVAQLVLTS